jgi:hypothetical protein
MSISKDFIFLNFYHFFIFFKLKRRLLIKLPLAHQYGDTLAVRGTVIFWLAWTWLILIPGAQFLRCAGGILAPPAPIK